LKKTTERYINEANKIHNNKYDYSKVIYTGALKKIKIICKKHGEFEQVAAQHLYGSGCKYCHYESFPLGITTEDWIKKAQDVHGDKYDYSLTEYKGAEEKLKIICRKHGEFEQQAKVHLISFGCHKCYHEHAALDKIDGKEFIEKANKIHNNKYDYSKVVYKKSINKVIIICPEHGEFKQRPGNHLLGIGCPKCAYLSAGSYHQSNTEIFIEKANKIHNNKYDYSLVNYKNNHTKVKIICPKHGIFEQRPGSHLMNIGCHYCNGSKGEIIIKNYLLEHNIKFDPQHKFDNCKYKQKLPFDFYLPDYNICIEYQGEQHYKSVKFFGGEEAFKNRKVRDKIKKNYCKKNNIKLIEIKYNKDVLKELQKVFK
jgi:hypothetical protein